MMPIQIRESILGAAAKRLSQVEVDPTSSNQHELNCSVAIKKILGEPIGVERIGARFVYLEDESDPLISESEISYYDARAANPRRSAEYRIYYRRNEVMEKANPADLLVLAALEDGNCLIAIAKAGSTYEAQLIELFEFQVEDRGVFDLASSSSLNKEVSPFTAEFLCDVFGIEIRLDDPNDAQLVREKFGSSFPPTAEFSEFARSQVTGVDPIADPDRTLLAWWAREFELFQALEREIVITRLNQGFNKEDEVGEFISFSLSVQNRRKSRSGHALQNHIAELLKANGIQFTPQATTERKSKPDFLFPSERAYHNPNFPESGLRMLAAKTTVKDRWRQILPEANRITLKHLITLDRAISADQMTEMTELGVQLVIPLTNHSVFSPDSGILSIQQFIRELSEMQSGGNEAD